MEDNNSTVIVYSPSGPVLQGTTGSFRRTRLMFRDLQLAGGLTWQLFLRDFRAKYRQSALGILWAILLPAATISLFTIMNGSGIIAIPAHDIPYPVYAIVGFTLWSFLASGVSSAAGALAGAGSMVVKINFPRIALVLSMVMQAMVDLMIRILLSVAVLSFYHYVPDPVGVVLAVAAFIPLLLLVIGLGCLLAILNVIFRDTSNIISVLFSIIMLLTPIFYPIGAGSLLGRINLWNPFNYLINVPRDLVLRGESADGVPFLVTALGCLVLFWLSWRIFFISQDKIAERI